jgi:subtilisin family serine protease
MMQWVLVGLLGAATVLWGQAGNHYIVELAAPPVADQLLPPSERGVRGRAQARQRLRSAAAESYRGRIRGEQRQAREHLEARRARVLGSVDTVANALFVELAGDDAMARLRETPGVKKVYRAREFRRVMDRVLSLHKVTEAWQWGNGRQGEGVRIGIIDSGIEASHPAFQDPAMTAPPGFPRYSSEEDAANTNGKVIVARSYVSLLPRRDPDYSSRDRVGHGTALAAIAAGVRTAAPLATVSGVAPKAYIGSYKVFGSPGYNDTATDAAILKAIEDAIGDGMDVISLSLGSDFAPRLEDDVEVQAIERATRAGVMVVVAAGNNGPGLNTIASPGTAPSAITVGAHTSDRTFAASVEVAGTGVFVAVNGSGPAPGAPVTGELVDVAGLDGNGLACEALAAGALAGRVALIRRGGCTFEMKLNNAQRAGATGAVVYATEQAPAAIAMSVGAATLPAQMVSNAAGVAMKERAAAGGAVVTMRFALDAVPAVAYRRASFSAAGPNVDAGIKPDILATGVNVYTATQTLDRLGDMYSATGFIQVNGTSFSTPVVAGAAALLRSERPGLTVDEYRSLIIHTAGEVFGREGEIAGLQQTGAGSLDVAAAIASPVAISPVSLSFGAGGGELAERRTLVLRNLGSSDETWVVETETQGSTAPVADSVRAPAGSSVEVPVIWTASGLAPGAVEGFLKFRAESSGQVARVPFWYAVMSPEPAAITVLSSTVSGRRGSVLRNAILFRVLDATGMNARDVMPQVTVESGGGAIRGIVSYDAEIPGLFGVNVQLGLNGGENTFRVQAGAAAVSVSITGQ